MSEPEQTASSSSLNETLSWDNNQTPGSLRDLTGMTLGDFLVERLLGRGGMGEVYLARQISLNRPVALKVLRPDLLTKPTYLSRFEAEATAVAKLNHPNIVHIYMLGNVDGIRFIAMEYVQGTNLRDYLQKKGALDVPLALSIMKQAGVAIGAAGERGLIHRDIKPENLLLTRKGQVKVADFGLCRDLDSARVHITQPGTTMGTPLYMSPEQAQGHGLDHRSDLYSLGVTFYHMLSGAPPFRADSALAIALKHVKDTPVSLCVHRADVPAELDRLVLKLMAKEPADRYQSAAEMLRDLAKVREALHVPSVSITEADLPTTAAATNGNATAANAPAAAATSSVTSRRPSAESEPATRGPRPVLGPGGRVALVATGLVAGLLWGWFTRTPDLLSERAEESTAMPALWMVPDWAQVENMGRPDMQYHHAQLRASQGDQEAAWLAVPGYFPDDREYTSKAYVQLARALLRHRDVDRLRVFAAEIARWKPGRTQRTQDHEKELAIIVQAAVDALDGDREAVLEGLGQRNLNLDAVIDPALYELALEVTDQASRSSAQEGGPGAVPPALREIKARLLGRLYSLEYLRDPTGLRRPG